MQLVLQSSLKRDFAAMKLSSLAAAAVFGLALTACASRPEPLPEPEAPRMVEQGPVTQPYQGPAPGSVEHFVATAGDRVFYSLDSYTLSNEARDTLCRQAAWLASYPQARILVAGNCDERGTREYNLALGARRASAARDYLISQGVDASRISTVSYGKERPSCTQSGEQCWAVNRNATTVVTTGASS